MSAEPGKRKRAGRKPQQLTYKGQTMSVVEWAAKMGMKECTLRYRLDCGWPVSLALGAPLNVRGSSFDRLQAGTERPDFGEITTRTVPDTPEPQVAPAVVPPPAEREAYLSEVMRKFEEPGNIASAKDVARACWDAGYLRAWYERFGRAQLPATGAKDAPRAPQEPT